MPSGPSRLGPAGATGGGAIVGMGGSFFSDSAGIHTNQGDDAARHKRSARVSALHPRFVIRLQYRRPVVRHIRLARWIHGVHK